MTVPDINELLDRPKVREQKFEWLTKLTYVESHRIQTELDYEVEKLMVTETYHYDTINIHTFRFRFYTKIEKEYQTAKSKRIFDRFIKPKEVDEKFTKKLEEKFYQKIFWDMRFKYIKPENLENE